MISTRQKEEILKILAPYQPVKVGIFGSYARGENTENSDLDILVKFNTRVSLLELVQLEQALSDQLNLPIDLLTENALRNPRLSELILHDLIPIHHA